MNKFDLLVESVRYSVDGTIDFVAAYERRGAAFSDTVIYPRKKLFDLLKSGKTVVSGYRKVNMGAVFEVKSTILLKDQVITNKNNSNQDILENVPLI